MTYIILSVICVVLLTFYIIWQHFYTKYDVYLSGPMSITGRKDLNYPVFNEIAKKLREQGLTVFNPAEVTKAGTPHWKCMITDINAVVNKCKKVYCIDGWRKSPGANTEVFCAHMCGNKVFEINPYSWKNYKTINITPVNTKSYKLPYEFNSPIINQYRDFDDVPKSMLDDLEMQRRSFAYGNTKISNDDISRDLIDREADKINLQRDCFYNNKEELFYD